MANTEGDYREHSDFFHTAEGISGPREAQLAIGRESRVLLTRHVADRAHALPDLVERMLTPTSLWPDARNLLLYAHLREVLLRPDTPQPVREIVAQVVTHAVRAGAREERSRLQRAMLRARALGRLADEIAVRRKSRSEPQDLLDVVARSSGRSLTQAAEVFLSFVFATTGSIGFLIGWSLLMRETGDATHVVREALRLRPVAWMFGRHPIRPIQIAGMPAYPKTEVLVCAYLVHRHPGYWPNPNAFRPGRWTEPANLTAYLPFGWGQHACTGAGIATGLAEDVLNVIDQRYRVSVAATGATRPVGPALTPPEFTLHTSERRCVQ